MPILRAQKFTNLEEMNTALKGGLIGTDVSKGIAGLVGEQVSFTAPTAATVTFVTATLGAGESRDTYRLMFKDIKAQIEAAVTGLTVLSIGGKIAFVEASPSGGVALAATSQVGKRLLGFDQNSAVVGTPVNADGSTVPFFVHAHMTQDNAHVVIVAE